ncbi:hypothetical protein BX661DRAFT_180238, partial [Kickxella alabastrina]|uniref:uncharacterized protein n=1 Tax=Kickxella alabastrina TaxID=61397 RepID=UPI0022209A6E
FCPVAVCVLYVSVAAADLLNDIVSNVNNALRPMQSLAGDVIKNINSRVVSDLVPELVSAAEQGGNLAIGAISNIANNGDTAHSKKIENNSESVNSGGSSSRNILWGSAKFLTAAGTVACICLTAYI